MGGELETTRWESTTVRPNATEAKDCVCVARERKMENSSFVSFLRRASESFAFGRCSTESIIYLSQNESVNENCNTCQCRMISCCCFVCFRSSAGPSQVFWEGSPQMPSASVCSNNIHATRTICERRENIQHRLFGCQRSGEGGSWAFELLQSLRVGVGNEEVIKAGEYATYTAAARHRYKLKRHKNCQ